MNTSWSLGVLIAGPILLLLIVASGFGVAQAWRWLLGSDRSEEYGDWGIALTISIIASVVYLALIVGIGFGYYPYKAEYHQWRPVTGQVAEVSKRLVGNGDGGMSEKIVVRFKGNPQEYGCEDTRCSLVKTKDSLDLKCKRAWQYSSTSGYDCRFVARRAS